MTQLSTVPSTALNIEPSRLFALVQADIGDGYQWLPARVVANHYHAPLETSLPALLTGLTDTEMTAAVLRALRNAYPSDHPLTLIWSTADQWQTQQASLATVQLTQFAATTCLYVPPLPTYSSFTALQEIIAHLRSPEGCPWDRAQTLASMRHDLLGECAEVLEAIDLELAGQENGAHIAEELGDLLMATLLMVQIATDEARFQLAQPVHSIVTKLIRRHPHVFGTVTVDGVETVLTNWDAIKAQEKAAKGQAPGHPLDGVPANLPALEKARQLQSKAVKAKLLDRAALAAESPLAALLGESTPSEDELGKLLWQLVALAHEHNLNPEDALRAYAVNYRAAQRV